MGYDEKASHKADDLAGKAKEGVGKVTGNERMKTEGKTDQAKTSAKEGVRKAKEGVSGVKDSLTKDDKDKRRKKK